MDDVFAWLTQALEGSAPAAMAGAFLWGVLSIVLSPCHLASIPLIIGFIAGHGSATPKRAFTSAVVFACGILVTIAAVGAITAALGRMLGDVGRYVNYGLGCIFLYLGLHFLGILPLPWAGGEPSRPRRRGLLGAFLMGLLFGVGVGPCTFAYMAPILGITLKQAASNALYAVILLLLYAVGHCSIIVLAGSSTQLVQRYLDWNEGSRGAGVLRQVCGILVILGGAYLVYTAP